MARVKRTGPMAKRLRLTPEEQSGLTGGTEIIVNPFLGPVMSKESWDFAGKQIMREWIRDHPGTRPPGWWEFDAPKDQWGSPMRRERIGGAGTSQQCTGYAWGIPLLWKDDLNPDLPPSFEGSARYLERLELFADREFERAPRELFEPESLLVTARGWEATPRNPLHRISEDGPDGQ